MKDGADSLMKLAHRAPVTIPDGIVFLNRGVHGRASPPEPSAVRPRPDRPSSQRKRYSLARWTPRSREELTSITGLANRFSRCNIVMQQSGYSCQVFNDSCVTFLRNSHCDNGFRTKISVKIDCPSASSGPVRAHLRPLVSPKGGNNSKRLSPKGLSQMAFLMPLPGQSWTIRTGGV
jgi:hypothetical protein